MTTPELTPSEIAYLSSNVFQVESERHLDLQEIAFEIDELESTLRKEYAEQNGESKSYVPEDWSYWKENLDRWDEELERIHKISHYPSAWELSQEIIEVAIFANIIEEQIQLNESERKRWFGLRTISEMQVEPSKNSKECPWPGNSLEADVLSLVTEHSSKKSSPVHISTVGLSPTTRIDRS